MPGTPEAVFGQHLREQRTAAGMSQQALADAVGVKQQTVGKWEAGAIRPTVDNLLALAEALPHLNALDAVLTIWPQLAEATTPAPRRRRAGGGTAPPSPTPEPRAAPPAGGSPRPQRRSKGPRT